jgi:hypothetical protein
LSLAVRELPSPNHDARPDGMPIDMLVLHYTGMRSGPDAIARLRDRQAKISAHYVVEEDGAVLRLVPEERRAWHAGVSWWRDMTALNGRSIGIEIVNPGHQWGYRPFGVLQTAAVCDLCLSVLSRHAVPARNVVGHSCSTGGAWPRTAWACFRRAFPTWAPSVECAMRRGCATCAARWGTSATGWRRKAAWIRPCPRCFGRSSGIGGARR